MTQLTYRHWIQTGQIEPLRRWLAQLATPAATLNCPDERGFTPLLYALSSPAVGLDLVALLLEAGADPNLTTHSTLRAQQSALALALNGGSLAVVELLLDYGADLHYQRAEGYNAVIDAVFGRKITRDSDLLALLSLLLARGAGVQGASQSGESALSVTSRCGRFDAVQLLLNAGADGALLGFTPLMAALAFQDLEAVRAQLEGVGPSALEARDGWQRTPWLLAVHTGDIAKAALLLDHGVDRNARDRLGRSALCYPIETRRHAMLRWLLELGLDSNAPDQFGQTPLMVAAGEGDELGVGLLLAHGADVAYRDDYRTALWEARTAGVICQLLAAGADPAELTTAGRRALCGFPAKATNEYLQVSSEDFARGHSPRFGQRNPEEIAEPFWEAMVRAGKGAWAAAEEWGSPATGHPVWCAERFGQSVTVLPAGGIIAIGGEHEDFYDEDFCIYNDVFFIEGERIRIFGYPRAQFPPTDFHTATLVGEFIYIIGSLGYPADRQVGVTPVFRLHTRAFWIEPVATSGEAPGWIHGHRADLVGTEQIRLTQGEIWDTNQPARLVPNQATFILDLRTGHWQRCGPEGALAE